MTALNELDFFGARRYAEDRLSHDLSASLTYHNFSHTFEDVLPAAERLANLENVQGEELHLLLTAAMFHDIGFVEQYFGHETAGVRIASQILPSFNYNPEQIETITGIIMATRMPQSPHTLLEKIMADADLDVIGRKDFLNKNMALRHEMEVFGKSYTDRDWFNTQLQFLQEHQYFTAHARTLNDEQKERNIRMLKILMNQSEVEINPAAPMTMRITVQDSLPVNERVTILRAVNLFSEMPDDILEQIAALLTPLEVKAGKTLFLKGEKGDCMYIIGRGRISIHDEEVVVNELAAADFFGEMALLDSEPRLASATAMEDTQLLRLEQVTLYELMAHHVEVAQGIIRVLNRRLRGRVENMAEDYRYIQQVGRITFAAAALEAGMYDSSTLDSVCKREDELGQLARVFQRMANEVQAREQRLKSEVQQLRIQVDEAKKAQQVAEITESEYFLQLQDKIRRIKNRPLKP
jgi:uncharacterized protein